MSLYHPKEVPISEPFPCPECGKVSMRRKIENCKLEDGFIIRRLKHYKCLSCGSRFFDDDAMHRIQAERAHHALKGAAG